MWGGEDPFILIFLFLSPFFLHVSFLSIQQIFSAYDFPGLWEEQSMCWKENWQDAHLVKKIDRKK